MAIKAKAIKATKKVTGKKLDGVIEAFFYKHGNCRQFNILDLGKIHRAGVAAYQAAETHELGLVAGEAAVAAACDVYEAPDKKAAQACTRALVEGALADLEEEGAALDGATFDFAIPGLVLS